MWLGVVYPLRSFLRMESVMVSVRRSQQCLLVSIPRVEIVDFGFYAISPGFW